MFKKIFSICMLVALSITILAPQAAFASGKTAFTVIIKYQERLTTTDSGKNINSRNVETHTTSIMAYNKREAEFKANEVRKDFEASCNCRIASVEVQ